MATILCSKNAVACISTNKFIIFSTSDAETMFEHQRVKPEPPKASEPKGSVGQTSESKESSGQTSESKEGSGQTSESKDSSGQSSKQGQATTGDNDPHQASGQILACRFSPSGNLFAVCDDYKQMTVWEFKTGWESVYTRIVARRCSAINFKHKEDTIYVADKSGDVYSFSLSNPTDDGVLISGHVSMLLDAAVSPDDRFLLTSDRDEKIRVSCLPNCYQIHTFCLGHTQDEKICVSCLPNCYHIHTFCLGHIQFVNRLVILPNIPNAAVSGSGDGTIRFWDYTEGRQLHCVSLDVPAETTKLESITISEESKTDENGDGVQGSVAHAEQPGTVACLTCCRKHNLVAVSLLNKPSVVIYQVRQTDSGLQCVQLCTLDCEVSPWSLCFDDDNRLWVLRPKESQPLVVYSFSEGSGSIKFNTLDPNTNTSNTSNLMTKINGSTQLFEGAYKQESFYSGLHKTQIDKKYVGSYMERKHQREQFQKQKRAAGQVKVQESTKKQKT